MKQALLPYLRTAKLLKLRAEARFRSVVPHPEGDRLPVRFVVGCGRSGTSILGHIISFNPRVFYMREPYHLWHAIDPRMDVTGVHSSPEHAQFFMGRDDATPETIKRYENLIKGTGNPREHDCVIEKTPHNACRIGWILEAEPDARILHIVRNGLSVVRSIDRIATRSLYKLAFKPNYNQWWGEHHMKWSSLSRDGAQHGYFPEEIDQIENHEQKGAYEWLVSLGEMDRWRETLGDQLLEITYTDLTEQTEQSCERIASHFDIPCDERWVSRACETLSSERVNEGSTLRLPARMCEQFNEYQRRYGFPGLAEPIGAIG